MQGNQVTGCPSRDCSIPTKKKKKKKKKVYYNLLMIWSLAYFAGYIVLNEVGDAMYYTLNSYMLLPAAIQLVT